MSIIGTHMLLYSSQPEALSTTLHDAFGFDSVDAGHGWLIFGLPPAELGVHPAENSAPQHQISFMCDQIHETVATLRSKGVAIDGEPVDQGWGVVVTMTL